MPLKKEIVWRVGVIYIFMLAFAFLIFGKIFYLQFIDGNKWKEKAQNYQVKLKNALKSLKSLEIAFKKNFC